MHSARIRFIGFSLTLSIFLAISGCDSKEPVADDDAKPLARPAKLMEVGQANNSEFLNYPAVIQSQQMSELAFEVGGMLIELVVVEAQVVKEGEVLARLDQRDLLANRDSALAQFENADTVYQRALRLIREDAISRSELEQRKSQHDVTRSQLDTAEKALQDSTLVAPYAGAIAKIIVAERQIVQPGEPAITILGNAGLEATINLPASILARASEQKESATDTYIVLDAAPDRRISIVFKEASLEADSASQTYQITFAFAAPEDLIILPGMNAIVWFRDPRDSVTSNSNVSVPLTAIATDGSQQFVWIVDNNTMTVSKRVIVVEAGVGASLRVISGLEPGEIIVSAGISALSEGMQVSNWSK